MIIIDGERLCVGDKIDKHQGQPQTCSTTKGFLNPVGNELKLLKRSSEICYFHLTVNI